MWESEEWEVTWWPFPFLWQSSPNSTDKLILFPSQDPCLSPKFQRPSFFIFMYCPVSLDLTDSLWEPNRSHTIYIYIYSFFSFFFLFLLLCFFLLRFLSSFLFFSRFLSLFHFIFYVFSFFIYICFLFLFFCSFFSFVIFLEGSWQN